MIQITNADTIYDLRGTSVQTGGSAGEGVSVGVEIVTGDGYMGININFGVGGGLTPVELHSIVEYAKVDGVNIFDLYNYILNLLKSKLNRTDCF
ncbi:MAG: hypothetical protein GY865_19205 [candidate division Zixibacteria bacterium]|nr:hypothetical protein [candidate division Zixibacteria bacterium]